MRGLEDRVEAEVSNEEAKTVVCYGNSKEGTKIMVQSYLNGTVK